MQVVSTKIVRGTATPGLEVEFRGEGGESVTIQLKDQDVASLGDDDILLKAKQMLTQIVAFGGSTDVALN